MVLPPLRERDGDIAELARYHLERMGIIPDTTILSALLPKIREIVTARKRVLESYELRSLYQEAVCL